MPARKKAETMAAKIRRIESGQKALQVWQTRHETECLRVYNQIQASTSVLPAMKAQLDAQDDLLGIIRSGQATYKIGKQAVLVLVGAVAFGNGLYSLLSWMAAHWH